MKTGNSLIKESTFVQTLLFTHSKSYKNMLVRESSLLFIVRAYTGGFYSFIPA